MLQMFLFTPIDRKQRYQFSINNSKTENDFAHPGSAGHMMNFVNCLELKLKVSVHKNAKIRMKYDSQGAFWQETN